MDHLERNAWLEPTMVLDFCFFLFDWFSSGLGYRFSFLFGNWLGYKGDWFDVLSCMLFQVMMVVLNSNRRV